MNKIVCLLSLLLPAAVTAQWGSIFTLEISNMEQVDSFAVYESDDREHFELVSTNTPTFVWNAPCFKLVIFSESNHEVVWRNHFGTVRVRWTSTPEHNATVACTVPPPTAPPTPTSCTQTIYPNPTTGILYTTCPGSWDVMDDRGRLVAADLTSPDLADTKYATGIYYLIFNKKQRFVILKQ